MHTIAVRASAAHYDVVLGSGLLGTLRPRLQELFPSGPRRCFIVTSPEIWRLWSGALLASFAGESVPSLLFVPAGEEHKRLATAERLLEELASLGADRGSVLLAFGGGVIGDVGGFVAATYMRGVDYVQLPTTLLAQVDSSVGGKTGVNLAAGKNLAGAFHHPRLVLADTDVLRSLPSREFRAGMAEVLKAGLIRDRELFSLLSVEREAILDQEPALLEAVIAAAVRIKAEVVGADEREAGERMLLNFGHTFGHALETATGYGSLLHGEAVTWGMLVALALSRARGLLSSADAEEAAAVIRGYGLAPLPPLDLEHTISLTRGDKKNIGGTRRFILLDAIGHAVAVSDVSDAELAAAAEATLPRTVPA